MPTLTSFTPVNSDMPSPLRSMHSLREKHVKVLVNVLSQLPDIWSLERHEGYDGDLSLMLTSEHQEDDNFFVGRRASGFHLIANRDDDCRELGCFDTVDELVATMWSSAVATTMKNKPGAGRL